MVLAGQLHCLALYHTHCPDYAEVTQRREVGTVPEELEMGHFSDLKEWDIGLRIPSA